MPAFEKAGLMVKMQTYHSMVYVKRKVTDICISPTWIGTVALGAAAPLPSPRILVGNSPIS